MTTGPLALDVVVRITLVLAAGLGVAWTLRRRSAALRHWTLAVTIVAALAAPVVARLAPGWPVPSGAHWYASVPVSEATTEIVTHPVVPAPVTDDEVVVLRPGATAVAGDVLLLIWIAGVAVCLLRLGAGLVRLSWIAASAEPIAEPAWTDGIGHVARRYGIGRPIRLLRSSHATLLATWGLRRPVVLLPAASRAWSPDRIRVVLAHELAHVARADWPLQVLAELTRALYWFHPLAWIVARRLQRESEHACDDSVLRSGVAAPIYAAELLDLARQLNRPPQPLPALTMARASGFEERITAMMNTRLDHGAATLRARVAGLVAVLALAAPVVTAQTGPGSLTGQVFDQTNRPVPGATLTATSAATGAATTTVSDATGQFTIGELPAGTYSVTVQMPGFRKHVVEQVTVGSGYMALAPISLAIGSLSEELTITGPREDPPGTVPLPAGPRASSVSPVQRPCTTDAVGGDIREPRKIRDVKPRYAAALRQQGIEGVVILEGRITGEGDVGELRVLRSVHADLDQAAIEAVEQWLFTPTLLNCEPVEVMMTVTVRFRVS